MLWFTIQKEFIVDTVDKQSIEYIISHLINDLHNVPIIFQIAFSIIFPDIFQNSNRTAKANKKDAS